MFKQRKEHRIEAEYPPLPNVYPCYNGTGSSTQQHRRKRVIFLLNLVCILLACYYAYSLTYEARPVERPAPRAEVASVNLTVMQADMITFKAFCSEHGLNVAQASIECKRLYDLDDYWKSCFKLKDGTIRKGYINDVLLRDIISRHDRDASLLAPSIVKAFENE